MFRVMNVLNPLECFTFDNREDAENYVDACHSVGAYWAKIEECDNHVDL